MLDAFCIVCMNSSLCGTFCDAGTCSESGYMSPWAVKCEERLQHLLTEQKERDTKIEYGERSCLHVRMLYCVM